MMTADEAFQTYESVRYRLPTWPGADVKSRRVGTLADIAGEFDVFLLDAFGVLNIGETPIPGTRERIDTLKAAGKRVLVVSNAAGSSHAALVEKYTRLGYEFAPEDIITSRATLLAGLRQKRGLHWGLMASRKTGLADLEGLSLTYLEDDPAPYAEVDGILMIGSADWTEARQTRLEDALSHRPRPVLVGNPDIVAPREGGFSSEPGHFAHRLADRAGVTPQFFGKPFGEIFERALALLGPVDRTRVLMVGDSLHTDILGAACCGVKSALVADFGFFAGEDEDAAIRRSGLVPDFILSRP